MEGFGAKLTYEPEDARKLRVLIISPCMHVSDGVSITIIKLIKYLKTKNIPVKIFTSDIGETVIRDREDLDERDFIFGPCIHLHYDPTDNYSVALMLTKKTKAAIKAFNPNVLHFTSPDAASFSVAEWGRKAGIPLIATWHSNIPDYLDHTGYFQQVILKPILNYGFKAIYKYALAIYAPQQATIDNLKRLDYQNLHVWGRGVNAELFNPANSKKSIREEFGFRKDQVIVLWVSRCTKEKRPDIYIGVLKQLEEKYPGKVVGLVVGRGDIYNDMVAVPNIVGAGWKTRSEVAELYASSDILLFPSAVETFGNVTLEGMASGLPVVADKGCSSHLVQHGVNGFTCSATSVVDKTGKKLTSFEQYYAACEKLVLDKDLRKRYGRKGRAIATEKFENTKILDEMVAHYVEAYELGVDKKVPPVHFSLDRVFVTVFLEAIDKIGAPIGTPLAKLVFRWKGVDKLFLFCTGAVGIAGAAYYFQK